MQRIFLALLLLLSAPKAFSQSNLYVDSSRAASGTGGSWATAYKTLNEALNVANNGSTTVSYTINIAKGTYYPTGVQSGTNRDSTFAFLRGGLRVYGGYPTGGGTRNIAANTTVLSGNIGLTNDSSDNAYHVVVMANISVAADSAILDGVTVANGRAIGISIPVNKIYNGQSVDRLSGGGIWIGQVDSNVQVRNCTFYRNDGYNGGAIYLLNANVRLVNNVFQINKAYDNGGAIYSNAYSYLSPLVCRNSVFEDNTAVTAGGAVYLFGDVGI